MLFTTGSFAKINYIRSALNVLIRRAQNRHFQEEMNDLARGQHFCTSNKMKSLTSLIYAIGILRIGGRYEFDECHPIILIANDPLTRPIIDKRSASPHSQMYKMLLMKNQGSNAIDGFITSCQSKPVSSISCHRIRLCRYKVWWSQESYPHQGNRHPWHFVFA